MSSDDMTPLVVDPPGFDVEAGWQEHADYVDQCGGLEGPDGQSNWRAAFGADPGCCSCPCCNRTYWAFGNSQVCRSCGFKYPTNAWSMFSWGVQARWSETKPPPAYSDPDVKRRMKALNEKRMSHPYFRWGYEHGDEFHKGKDNLRDHFEAIDWRVALCEKCGGAGYIQVPPDHYDGSADRTCECRPEQGASK